MTDEKKKAQDRAFLGYEFLLWLFRRTSDDSYFDLSEFALDSVEVFLEDRISLESLTGDGFSEKIRADDITGQRDVYDSIREGRVPAEVKMRIIRGPYEWFFTLSAMPPAIKSVKLPADSSRDNPETMEHRLQMIEMVDDIIRALFNVFLFERDGGTMTDDLRTFFGLTSDAR